MKKTKYFSLFIVGIALMSCGNGDRQGADTPLAASVAPKQLVIPANKNLCFQQVSGSRNEDTLTVKLHFQGDQVTGTMTQKPYEKDARTGVLSGLLLQPDIKANWIFMQEGMKDSIELDFRLGDDALWQRPLNYNANTGKEQTDTSAGFTQKIPLVDCSA